jgi:hypothetical protein
VQATLRGWPLELLAELSAAPDRAVAENLFALSREAVDALPDDTRELVLARAQDIITEFAAADAHRLAEPVIPNPIKESTNV